MSNEREMTHGELMALPVTISLETANRALMLGRTTGYSLAKRGQYPVPLLPRGRGYVVSRYHLHRYLGVEAVGQDAPDAA
ncbi:MULTISPECIES: integrase [Streptomyces]|nr:integrase [Streptomyces kasugaensis]